MNTFEIRKVEASIFVEYIQNYINDSLSGFHEKHAREIDSSVISFNALSPKALKKLVDFQVVQPYTAFVGNLATDLNLKICEYFGLEPNQFFTLSFDNNIYRYNPNGRLISEYDKTEKLSGLMEKLINKTLDFTCLNQMETPIVKKFVDPLSVGSLFMCCLGLDSSIQREKSRNELCKTLKGIGKNISIRAKNFLSKQYATLIYQLIEENQEIFYDEQAI
jgi:hypothetical protein